MRDCVLSPVSCYVFLVCPCSMRVVCRVMYVSRESRETRRTRDTHNRTHTTGHTQQDTRDSHKTRHSKKNTKQIARDTYGKAHQTRHNRHQHFCTGLKRERLLARAFYECKSVHTILLTIITSTIMIESNSFICWGLILKFTNTANEPIRDPLMQMGFTINTIVWNTVSCYVFLVCLCSMRVVCRVMYVFTRG